MNKFLRMLIVLMLCLCMALPAACKKDKGDSSTGGSSGSSTPGQQAQQRYNPETRPVVFAIGALDGNFNPFFYTSANDGGVAGMTQISMLSSNSEGKVACGEDEPTVVLDYKITMYNPDGTISTGGNMDGHTVYEFVIKNGIKFSDGVDLTIKDVLFNLYVNLDPAYTGSATIYSTDIIGLDAYRAQDPDYNSESGADYESGFYATASGRVQNLIAFLDPSENNGSTAGYTNEQIAQFNEDIALTKKLFEEELTSDWNNNYGSLESYEKEFTFTEDWQTYLYNAGLITIRTQKSETGGMIRMKDENGKYITSLDDDPLTPGVDDSDPISALFEEAVTEDKVAAYAKENDISDLKLARSNILRDLAIETVYNSYFALGNSKIPDILRYWATGTKVIEDIAAQERSDYYKQQTADGGLKVPAVSGITTRKTDEFNGKALGEQHDVLVIDINGVDPKAIWNFGFNVAPMHYYSNAEQTALAMADKGTERVDDATGVTYIDYTQFGVKFNDKDFFDNVLKDKEKTGLPVGAGTYKASSATGTNVNRSTFFNNNIVYYERNTYFETVGSGLNNAKIKYFNYKVTGDNNIVNSLIAGDIDYGEPGATTQNISKIGEYSHLGFQKYETGGYGYVGINPKFVPDIEVRQAIMHALNPATIIKTYYTESLASLIYRPISNTSWAKPNVNEEYYEYWGGDDKNITKMTQLLELAEWKEGSQINDQGVRIREKNGKQLKLTFTIAGESTDHPAYSMFVEAEPFLEKCGFDITIKTNIQALRLLATGGLEVWAAAWSSGIDPDMYQIYHKDSTATSTNNWYRDGIMNDTTGQFDEEKVLVEELALLIEEGRTKLNQDDRKPIYWEALDIVMQLAVELPTYQRNDLVVYNTDLIDEKTLNNKANYLEGVVSELWNLNFN